MVANSTPEMKHWLTIIMMIYAFEIPFEILQSTLQLALKSLGKIDTVLAITMATTLIGNTTGCLILQAMHHDVVSYFALTSCFMVVVVVSLAIGLMSADWSRAVQAD